MYMMYDMHMCLCFYVSFMYINREIEREGEPIPGLCACTSDLRELVDEGFFHFQGFRSQRQYALRPSGFVAQGL